MNCNRQTKTFFLDNQLITQVIAYVSRSHSYVPQHPSVYPQCTVQSLYKATFCVHRNVPCYNVKFYKGIIIKWPFHGHFPIIPLYNSMVKKYGSHNMTVLYPNPCYNEVCGAALYKNCPSYCKFHGPLQGKGFGLECEVFPHRWTNRSPNWIRMFTKVWVIKRK